MTTRVVTVTGLVFDAPGLDDLDLEKKLGSEDKWRGAAVGVNIEVVNKGRVWR